MRLGVAVSGGADSVCLLHVLLELAPRWNLKLHVLHVNHNLRGEESKADAEFVGGLAAGLGLPFTIREVDLSGTPDNLEQAARRTRLAFFREMIGPAVDRVALGHTKSDQAETVLFRFLRGSGTAGLAGIRPVTSTGLMRPLIEVSREDVEQFLRDRQISWRNDSTNRDPRFARNRIRHELLPRLAREWNPGVVDTLAQTARWAADEEAWWAHEIDRLATCLVERRNTVLAPLEAIASLPAASARRLIRRAIERGKGDLRRIDFSHIQGVLDLATGSRMRGRIQLPGLEVLRSSNWLCFAKLSPQAPDYTLPVTVPGTVEIPAAAVAFQLELIEKSGTFECDDCVYNDEVGCLEWLGVSGPLVMRNWRPGDWYQPAKGGTPRKLKTLFQEARIPLWERRSWPVLTDGTAIIWAWRFGPAAGRAAGRRSSRILKIREMELA